MRVRRPCLLALAYLSFGTIGLLFAETPAAHDEVPEPPPEPKFQDDRRGSVEEWHRARDAFEIEHTRWESGLSAAQVLLLEQRRDAEAAKRYSTYRERYQLPTKEEVYHWAQQAAESKLSPSVIAALERDKIAFGASVKQPFEPYMAGTPFITSDSALNAFHVLLEDSFRVLEMKQAASFRSDFETILAQARRAMEPPTRGRHEPPLPAERFGPAIAFLERVLGPALVTCGTPLEFFPSDAHDEITSAAASMQRAEASGLPEWLGPADPDTLLEIDFRRCKPVGFYAEEERLTAYFRAVRWLQMIPFRASREHELDAMILLVDALEECALLDLHAFHKFLGVPDDPTMFEVAAIYGGRVSWLATDHGRRVWFARRLIERDFYRINSDVRARRTLDATFDALTFRVLSSVALPDAVLFQYLLDRELKPSGIAYASTLGSTLARSRLDPATTEALQATLYVPDPLEPSYGAMILRDYEHTLRALFLPVEPAAPAFMHAEIWQAKNCQTALASWAQVRNLLSLQAKSAINIMGMKSTPPGFVEENPEFFARLARLVDKTADALDNAGCLQPANVEEADRMRQAAAILRRMPDQPLPATPRQPFVGISDKQLTFLWSTMEGLGHGPGWKVLEALPGPEFGQRRDELLAELEKRATDIELGAIEAYSQIEPLSSRWKTLSRIVHTLEALAHKELRGAPWSAEDEIFLRDYGRQIAGVLGYFGTSWLIPRDDAPRWAEVCAFTNRGTSLAAAVGRPREIFVLHPWQGMEVLCRGSVMQYYEYESSERLTDDEWRGLLDSEKVPALPPWLGDFIEPPTFDPKAEH